MNEPVIGRGDRPVALRVTSPDAGRGATGRSPLPTTRCLRARAYAKVNLALEVLGRRGDGYHEIVSVVQTISLHDLVECAPAAAIDVQTEPPLVEPAENLVTRAAELLAADTGRRVGADVLIRKRVPPAAGLGGGSSDAATALRLLDRLWATDLPPADLARLAGRLGSDVPLFLVGGAVLIRGRGEQVRSLAASPPFWLALACPSCRLADKTRALYSALGSEDWSDGRRTLALADRLAAGASPVGEQLPNAFGHAAAETYPGFPELRRRLAVAAGAPLHLTGAGPSLFALYPDRPAAAAAARRMARLGVPCHVASSVRRAPIIRSAAGPAGGWRGGDGPGRGRGCRRR